MSAWAPKHGAAIISNSYIANGPHQMTVIPGDIVSVIETNGLWHRGKNLVTRQTGIFPAACCHLKETEDTSLDNFLSNTDDLIFYEASVTLDAALNAFTMSKTSQETLKLSEYIFKVVSQLEQCQLGPAVQIDVARAMLGDSLDKLRGALGIERIERSFTSNQMTLSTYGREGIASKKMDEVKKTEYVVLHVNLEIRTLKKPVVCRFFLYDPVSKKFLSSPVSVLTNEGSKYDLLFDQLEPRHVQMMPGDDGKNASLWLCIYTFDLNQHKDSVGDERKFLACAAVRLPRMKSLDSSKYFGKCKTTEVQSLSGPKQMALELHKVLCNRDIPTETAKKLTRAGPSFQVKFTPVFGVAEEIIKRQNLKDVMLIPPLLLPLQLQIGMKRNMLTVTIGNIVVDSHPKKIRIAVRLLDADKGVFTKGIEKLTSVAYDSDVWLGPVVSGKRPTANEMFAIDLDAAQAPLSSLYLVIQLEKPGVTIPFAYALVRLSSDVGSLTKELDKSIVLYEFKPSGKVVVPKDFPVGVTGKKRAGTADYHIDPASTVVTQDEHLYRLLHMKECKDNLTESLKNFMFCGISEWSKFAPELMLSLCTIIVNSEENAQLAFTSLQSMFAEMLSKAGSDYSKLMHQFMETEFERAAETDPKTVTRLCSKILSVIMNVLDGSIQDQDYRTCIKTLPYHVELIGRSYVKEPKKHRRKNILKLFDKLNEIIGHIETDRVANSFYLTNQRLLLQHFATMVDDLPIIFGVDGACEITRKFITSIRTDNDQINKAKMQLLWDVVGKGALWTKDTQAAMRELYTEQINWAFTKASEPVPERSPRMSQGREESLSIIGRSPDLLGKAQLKIEDYIYRILMSLFFVSNDDYAISFLSQLSEEQRESNELTMLLLTIAFSYPEKFPFDELIKTAEHHQVSAHELLFVLIHVATARKQDILERVKKGEGKSFFACALELAHSCGSSTGERVDRILNSYIYSINNDMSILVELFEGLPLSEKVDYDIGNQLLRVYTYFQAPVLPRLWYHILKSDLEMNGNTKAGRRATLKGLWAASQLDNFEVLNDFFTDTSTPEIAEFSRDCADIVKAIETVEKRELSETGEDERADALIFLLGMARESEDRNLQLKILKLMVQLNVSRQNNVEAAYTYSEILKLIPCDETKLKKPILRFKAKCGRELHIEMLFEIIQLLIASNYEEFALPFCDQLIETCVERFGHIELMPRIMSCRENIYRNISSKTRSFSSFIRASFYGKGFSKCYRDRTFVYRRGDAVGTNAFKEELKHTFSSNTVIGSDTPTEEQLKGDDFRYIQLTNVVPSSLEEAQDPFHRPEYKLQPRYITDFEEYNRPTVFRADILSFTAADVTKRGSLSAVSISVTQQFVTVKNTFPYFARRVEVDTSKTVAYTLSPIDNATVVVARKNREIINDYRWMSHKLEGNQRPDNETISRLAVTIEGAVHAGTTGKTKGYIETFLAPDYLNQNRDQEKNVERFKEALQEQIVYVLKSTRVLKEVETKETKDANAETAKNLLLMIKLVKGFGVAIDLTS